jgi:pyrroloquinoline quinone biosynthesis protein B
MYLKVLGSAAGGGFPQWNCACSNCSSVRLGTFSGKARTQAQIAVSGDGQSWFLLGASPDLRLQIESSPELNPRGGVRQSPIAGVVLAGSDLDQVLGLLSLRELQRLRIYATGSVHRLLCEDNSMFAMLNRVPEQARWTDVCPSRSFSLESFSGLSGRLRCELLPLASRYPPYVAEHRALQLTSREALQATLIEDSAGKRLAYLPAVPAVDDDLLKLLESTDLLFFDGTFWSDDELVRIQGNALSAKEMGHIAVSSTDGSLSRLAKLRRPRKIFLHINNTNPMLNESGDQYREVRAAGWQLAEDGWNIQL